jgi:hypothetical protein
VVGGGEHLAAHGLQADPGGQQVLENRRRALALTRLREAADGPFDLALPADKGNYRR